MTTTATTADDRRRPAAVAVAAARPEVFREAAATTRRRGRACRSATPRAQVTKQIVARALELKADPESTAGSPPRPRAAERRGVPLLCIEGLADLRVLSLEGRFWQTRAIHISNKRRVWLFNFGFVVGQETWLAIDLEIPRPLKPGRGIARAASSRHANDVPRSRPQSSRWAYTPTLFVKRLGKMKFVVVRWAKVDEGTRKGRNSMPVGRRRLA